LCTSGTNSYCNQLWSACASVDISNSPFEPVLQNGSAKATAPLSSFYNSSADFCAGETAGSDSFCFNGTALQLPPLVAHTPPAGMCLERLDNATAGFGYYLNLVPHPDGSDRVFVNTQDGHVFLVNVSLPGSGQPFGIDYSSPFLDISNRTISSGELGMMGIVFHPNFLNNGRFFISYDCDSTKFPDCKASQCGCSANTGCNLTAIGPSVCQFSAIVAEYTVNATGVTPQTVIPSQSDVNSFPISQP
jgi:hypothetical protein